MARTFTTFSAFAAFLAVALSCSCFRGTFEEGFCKAKLSVRAKVLFKFDNCPGNCDPINDQGTGKFFYLVRVIDTFKGSSSTYIILQTAVNSALCGVNLTVGAEYLFNLGNIQASPSFPYYTYPIGLCSFPQLWNTLTPAQKHFVQTNGNYGTGCKKLTLAPEPVPDSDEEE